MSTIDMSPTGDLRFLRVSVFRSLPGSEHYRMWNDYELLLVVTDGRVHWENRQGSHSASPGDIIYHPSRLAYEEWTTTQAPASGYKLLFKWPGARDHLGPLTHDQGGHIRAWTERLQRSWALHTQMRGGRDSRRPNAEALMFFGVIGGLLDLAQRRPSDLQQQVRAYTMRYLDQPFSLTELAEHVGYTPSYLVRKFGLEVGHSPMEEVRRHRLEMAHELVLSTDQTAKAIAEQVGLADGAHLARLFRRYYGMTITQLRRLH